MKITMHEYEGCFSFELEAETLADAALLTRFGMNATRTVQYVSCNVNQGGKFEGGLVISKHKRANSDVPKRK